MKCTTVRFIDTNILLYAVSDDPVDREQRLIADEILSARDLALSTQVLQEFYVQATRQSREFRLTHGRAMEYVTVFARFPVQSTTLELVRAAMATRERYQISYWDAAIVEAARALGCTVVLSEDLNYGQSYDGVVVVDPFR